MPDFGIDEVRDRVLIAWGSDKSLRIESYKTCCEPCLGVWWRWVQ